MSASPQKSNPETQAEAPSLEDVKSTDSISGELLPVKTAKNPGCENASQDEARAASEACRSRATKPASDNIILSSVHELVNLYIRMEEVRAELRARGILGQSTNVMVEMAFHNRQGDMQGLMDAALQASEKAYGHGAISRKELQEALDNLLALEKDIAYTRKLCKQRGLDLQVINYLTQIVRKNPGDGGEKSINTFLAYAIACNIELSGIDAIQQKYTTEPASVLPDIRKSTDEHHTSLRYTLLRDAVIGALLTIGLMALIA